MKEHLKLNFIGITLWWILLLPFDYSLFDRIFKTIQKPFTGLLKTLDEALIFETDTYGTYILISLSILFGALFSPVISQACAKLKWNPTQVLKTSLAAILFFFLFKYGWDKITKSQFYLPEPNTAYTPFGKLSKDIAYWSLVGSSYSYTVTLGIIEVFTALLLLFKRTQFLASLLAIAVFTQVVLVNFSFDISVKLLSCSLLLFSIVYSSCFAENWKSIFGFQTNPIFPVHSKGHLMLRFCFAFLVIAECIFPTISSRNFNDDRFPRLAHHGAYRVYGSSQIKHLFVHRQHYLILQSHQDEFKDYNMEIQSHDRYVSNDGTITCNWQENLVNISGDTFRITKIPYRKLPLLQESFHTFSDEFH
ncbi:hypothetical protein [Fluviicola chungangensis]|uniref:DoxX family protein n=1 Tax=Fluviicola chungangensis TaxID=2597671 RepID=A0A556N7C5_9FLAO|nr:hypothetical protein [Fluviicola chungangensis]TSJ48082.1 hypothetical protein FO442_02815 [Fluviicola chungangensis]